MEKSDGLLLKRSADRIRARSSVTGTDGNFVGSAIAVAVVINAVLDVAGNALDMLRSLCVFSHSVI